MSAKDAAIKDIMSELNEKNKCFITFRKDLNPIMRTLVKDQIKAQSSLNLYHRPNHSNSQLVAHCFFSKSQAQLSNYTKYYEQV